MHLSAKCRYFVLAAALLLCATAQAAPLPQDLVTVRKYLAAHHAGKTWQVGPTQIDTAELRKLLPRLRFWYVFSSPPLPPGAPLKESLDAYNREMAAYHRHRLTAVVQVSGTDTIGGLDIVHKLPRVQTDAQSKAVAAAVLSLTAGDRVAPGPISAADVEIAERPEGGWLCVAQSPHNFLAQARFSPKGKLLNVIRMFAGSLPP